MSQHQWFFDAILSTFMTGAATVEKFAGLDRLLLSPNDQQQDPSRLHFVVAMFLANTVPSLALNCIFELLIRLIPMEKLARFRFNGTKMPNDFLILQGVLVTTFYHFVAPVMLWYSYPLIIKSNPGLLSNDNLPSSIWVFLFQLLVCYMFTDFLFFIVHKALHESAWAYQNIHRIHHRFIITVGWAAEYSHPIEWYFGNVMPVVAACLLFKYHAVVWISWSFVAITGTVIAHCGFKFPGAELLSGSRAGYHDHHHSHNVGNFGHSELWDHVFGTDKAWQKFCAKGGKDDADADAGDAVIGLVKKSKPVSEEEAMRRLSAALSGTTATPSPKKKTKTTTARSASSKKKTSASSKSKGRSKSKSKRA